MKNGLLGLLVFLSLHVSVHAADKIRIGFPEFNSSTFTLPLAHLHGFFHEEGLQAELIRIRSAVALPALTSGEIDYHTVVSSRAYCGAARYSGKTRSLFCAGTHHCNHRSSRV